MVSNEHVSILGNKPMSLEDIHYKMTQYYKKSIEKIQKKWKILLTRLRNLKKKKNF